MDNHDLALSVYAGSVPHGWPTPEGPAKAFFERHFCPTRVSHGTVGHLTGYFEPVISAARSQSPEYCWPLYPQPDETENRHPPTRQQIDQGALSHLQPIAWLASKVDAYVLHVQGSGRLVFPNGQMCRVGFAGKNGHPYVSIGKILVTSGEVPASEISLDAIRNWCAQNPDRVDWLFWQNPSYIFFKETETNMPQNGPIGSAGVPLTPDRSLAVDQDYYEMGCPIWMSAAGKQQLMVAQDTGSAIKGSQRADLFVGTGNTAGTIAGSLNQAVDLIALLPSKFARRDV